MDTDGSGNKLQGLVVLRWSHLIFSLIIWLFTLGAVYGTMRSQVDEAQRTMQELKDKKVDQRQFDELRDDLIRRLDSIEADVRDLNRNLHGVH